MKITDEQRLDFIQKTKSLLDASCVWSKNKYYTGVEIQGRFPDITAYGRTVRDAIDKAIRRKR